MSRKLGRRDEAGGVLVRGLPDPHLREGVMREVRRESAHHHAVIVLGILLRFLQRRDAAAAAFVHVGELGRAAIESGDGSFRGDGHFVRGAIAEVDDLFRMRQRIAGAVLMSGILSRHREAAVHGRREPAEAEVAAESAIARAAQLAVPPGYRHPDFDFDF